MEKTALLANPKRPCFRLSNIRWRTYVRMVHAFAEQPAVRLAYDDGELEIMSPSLVHDFNGRFLGQMVVALTQLFGLPIRRGGSTTLKRRLKKKGIEADECFWIKNAPKMAGKRRLDLRTDPPPDLAIEIDVSSSSLNRLGIYAALKVPEVWRWEDDTLTFYILGKDCELASAPVSNNFPGIEPSHLVPFLMKAQVAADENEVEREFREWISAKFGIQWNEQ